MYDDLYRLRSLKRCFDLLGVWRALSLFMATMSFVSKRKTVQLLCNFYDLTMQLY